MIDRVTITGADDTVDPQTLVNLAARYPFVEWGILVSATRFGTPRYPSDGWLREYQRLACMLPLRSSLHLCGRYVRELLLGRLVMPPTLFIGFQRVQLNFHDEHVQFESDQLLAAMRDVDALNLRGIEFGEQPASDPRQWIFQIDSTRGRRVFDAVRGQVNAVPLFDTSGGAGVLPDAWPLPFALDDNGRFLYHGYAGGLGPENLAVQIPAILKAAHDEPVWIDMETRVRADGGRKFDLIKTAEALEIAKAYVA